MLKSYFKTAWRNLLKNRVFSLINIAGLAIGMAACLLILQYVNFELSYDRYNKNIDDLYRVTNDRYPEREDDAAWHDHLFRRRQKAMQDAFPEVVESRQGLPAAQDPLSVMGTINSMNSR